MIDLGGPVPHQTLGTMIYLLDREENFGKAIRATVQHDASWLCGVLPRQLAPLRELRNNAAHSDRIGLEDLLEVREDLLGIGKSSVVAELIRVRLRL